MQLPALLKKRASSCSRQTEGGKQSGIATAGPSDRLVSASAACLSLWSTHHLHVSYRRGLWQVSGMLYSLVHARRRQATNHNSTWLEGCHGTSDSWPCRHCRNRLCLPAITLHAHKVMA